MAIKINGNTVLQDDASKKQLTLGYNETKELIVDAKVLSPKSSWNIDTAAYTGNSWYLGYLGGTPSGMFFRPDGLRLFTVGESVDSVVIFDLTTPWDISTASYTEALRMYNDALSMRDIHFRPDGHRMYIYDYNSKTVMEWHLDIAWDIFTASFIRNNVVGVSTRYIGNYETAPSDVYMSTDGLRAWVLGDSSNDIFEFSLGTAYDFSTSKYVKQQDLNTVSGTATPGGFLGFTWQTNGTKLFVTDYITSSVLQFTAATAWDVSTLTYNGKSTLNNVDAGLVHSIDFNSTGTKFWTVADNHNTLIEWNCATAWTVTSGVTYGRVFNVSDYDVSPSGFRWSADGKHAMLVGSSSDRLWVFDCDTAYDFSTHSFNSVYYMGAPQETAPSGVFASADGKNIVVCGTTGDDFTSYTLSTAWDVNTTNTYACSVHKQGLEHCGLSFKPDGTRFFLMNSSGATLEEYALDVPWELKTATLVKSKGIAEERDPTGIYFRKDGKRLFVTGSVNDRVISYKLATPWDIDTIELQTRYYIGGQAGASRGLTFKPDGSKFWVLGTSSDRIFEFEMEADELVIDSTTRVGGDLKIGGDIVAAAGIYTPGAIEAGDTRTEYLRVEKNIRFGNDAVINPAMDTDLALSERIGEESQFLTQQWAAYPAKPWISADGTRFWLLDRDTRKVHEFATSEPYNLNNITFVKSSADLRSVCGTYQPYSIWFRNTGTEMWLLDLNSKSVCKMTMSTAWDVSTLSFTGMASTRELSVSAEDTTTADVVFKPDGLKMYVLGDAGNEVNQYNLSTAWRIDTATYYGKFDGDFVKGETNREFNFVNMGALSFKSDGTRMYIADVVGTGVMQLTLSTAWDVTTATFDQSHLQRLQTADGSVDDMWMNTAGTIMFTVDGGNIRKYTLSTAWNLTTATLAQTLTVTQHTAPVGIHVKSDGLRFWVQDTTIEAVIEYRMTTAWDLTTAYIHRDTIVEKDISANTTAPVGITFGNNGTRMYVAAQTQQKVIQYNLSTAYNISTASFNQDFFVGNEVGTVLQDVEFSSDGLKMFVNSSTAVYRYTLSTAWNVSTASLHSSANPVDEGGLLGIASLNDVKFSADGLQMYVIGSSTDKIFQYKLSTAYDITTREFVSDSRTLVDSGPQGVTFCPRGIHMFIVGSSYDYVGMYRLKTPWMIASAEYVTREWVGNVANPRGIAIKPDGTHFYVVGDLADSVFDFTLGTPFDISSIQNRSVWGHYWLEGGSPGMAFSNDGLWFYVTGTTTDSILTWKLNTAYDLRTAYYWTRQTGTANDTYEYGGITWHPSGTYFYYADSASFRIWRYTCATAWDTSSVSSAQSLNMHSFGYAIGGLWISNNGLYLYVAETQSDDIIRITLGTAWDLTTANLGKHFDLYTNGEANPRGMEWKSDGTKFYIVGTSGDEVNQYTCSTAWDIGTAAYEKVYRVNGYAPNPHGFHFKSDGLKFWIVDTTWSSVFEYTLTTAWDVATASLTTKRYIGDKTPLPYGVAFNSTGTSMFVVDEYFDKVVEYTLPTAWSIASLDQGDLGFVDDKEASPRGFSVSSDRTKFFVMGSSSDDVHQYNMSTTGDPATAAFNQTFNPGFSGEMTDLEFSKDGKHMWFHEINQNKICQYDLSTAWDISTAANRYVWYAGYFTTLHISSSTYYGAQGINFSDDGYRMYMTNEWDNTCACLKLDTPFDLRSVYPKCFWVYEFEGAPGRPWISNDGSKLFTYGSSTDAIRQYSLPTPWEITDPTYDSVSLSLATWQTAGYNMNFSPDGLNLYTTGTSADQVVWHKLTKAYDLTTATLGGTLATGEAQDGGQVAFDVAIKYDGSTLYVLHQYTSKINQWKLSTPWDITTATLDKHNGINCPFPTSMTWKPDGTRLYVVDDDTDSFYEFQALEPWDVTTLRSYRRKQFPKSFYNPMGLWFNPNGDKVYFSTSSADFILGLPITENYLSLEGRVAVNGAFSVGGKMSNKYDVANWGNVSIGRDDPRTALDVGDRKDGIVFPTGTTAERPAGAPAGTVRYNTTNAKLEICLGADSWTDLH